MAISGDSRSQALADPSFIPIGGEADESNDPPLGDDDDDADDANTTHEDHAVTQEGASLPNPWLDNPHPKSASNPGIVYRLKSFLNSGRVMRSKDLEWPYRLYPKNHDQILFFEFRGFGRPSKDFGSPGDFYLDLTPHPRHFLYVRHANDWICNNNDPDPSRDEFPLHKHPLLRDRYLWATRGWGFMWFTGDTVRSGGCPSVQLESDHDRMILKAFQYYKQEPFPVVLDDDAVARELAEKELRANELEDWIARQTEESMAATQRHRQEQRLAREKCEHERQLRLEKLEKNPKPNVTQRRPRGDSISSDDSVVDTGRTTTRTLSTQLGQEDLSNVPEPARYRKPPNSPCADAVRQRRVSSDVTRPSSPAVSTISTPNSPLIVPPRTHTANRQPIVQDGHTIEPMQNINSMRQASHALNDATNASGGVISAKTSGRQRTINEKPFPRLSASPAPTSVQGHNSSSTQSHHQIASPNVQILQVTAPVPQQQQPELILPHTSMDNVEIPATPPSRSGPFARSPNTGTTQSPASPSAKHVKLSLRQRQQKRSDDIVKFGIKPRQPCPQRARPYTTLPNSSPSTLAHLGPNEQESSPARGSSIPISSPNTVTPTSLRVRTSHQRMAAGSQGLDISQNESHNEPEPFRQMHSPPTLYISSPLTSLPSTSPTSSSPDENNEIINPMPAASSDVDAQSPAVIQRKRRRIVWPRESSDNSPTSRTPSPSSSRVQKLRNTQSPTEVKNDEDGSVAHSKRPRPALRREPPPRLRQQRRIPASTQHSPKNGDDREIPNRVNTTTPALVDSQESAVGHQLDVDDDSEQRDYHNLSPLPKEVPIPELTGTSEISSPIRNAGDIVMDDSLDQDQYMTSPLLSPLFSELDEPFDFVMDEAVDGTETSHESTSPAMAEDTPLIRMGQRYSVDPGYNTDPDELSEANEDTFTYLSSSQSTASRLTTTPTGTPPATLQRRPPILVWYDLISCSHREFHDDVPAGKATHTWLLSDGYKSNASESEQSEIDEQREMGREQCFESRELLGDRSKEAGEEDAEHAVDLDEHMEEEEEADDEDEDEEEEGGEDEEEGKGDGEEEEECENSGQESYLMDTADDPEDTKSTIQVHPNDRTFRLYDTSSDTEKSENILSPLNRLPSTLPQESIPRDDFVKESTEERIEETGVGFPMGVEGGMKNEDLQTPQFLPLTIASHPLIPAPSSINSRPCSPSGHPFDSRVLRDDNIRSISPSVHYSSPSSPQCDNFLEQQIHSPGNSSSAHGDHDVESPNPGEDDLGAEEAQESDVTLGPTTTIYAETGQTAKAEQVEMTWETTTNSEDRVTPPSAVILSSPKPFRFEMPQSMTSGEWTASSIHWDDIVLHRESSPLDMPSSLPSEDEIDQLDDEEPNIADVHASTRGRVVKEEVNWVDLNRDTRSPLAEIHVSGQSDEEDTGWDVANETHSPDENIVEQDDLDEDMDEAGGSLTSNAESQTHVKEYNPPRQEGGYDEDNHGPNQDDDEGKDHQTQQEVREPGVAMHMTDNRKGDCQVIIPSNQRNRTLAASPERLLGETGSLTQGLNISPEGRTSALASPILRPGSPMLVDAPMDDTDSAIRNAADLFHFLSTSHLDIRNDRDALKARVKKLTADMQEEKNARLAAEQRIAALTLEGEQKDEALLELTHKLNEYRRSLEERKVRETRLSEAIQNLTAQRDQAYIDRSNIQASHAATESKLTRARQALSTIQQSLELC